MEGTPFGRYRLIMLIGEGGMGKVYKAHDTVIDRDVAIKVLPTELGALPGYRERFRREAHTAARLTEPHIIPIHDTGEIDGQLYLVMPVIDGIDVHTLLKRDGPMSPQQAVRVIEELATALDAAHKHGLVHRDIKPSNALMTSNGFVYLIDFGVAHDVASATKLTQTGSVIGTMAYMAPERLTTGIADARADVYALACVLHECLTGAQPYPGTSMEQQITAHLTLDPPKPSSVNPAIPAGFDEVIARGMAKDPAQRYQTAQQLATAAHHALTTPLAPPGEPTLLDDAAPTTPATEPAAQQQPADLHRAATQHRPPGWPPAPQPRPADRPPPQRWMVPAVLLAVILLVVVIALVWRPWQRPNSQSSTAASTTAKPITPSTTSTSTAVVPPAPVAAAELQGLLLGTAAVNSAMHVSGMTVTSNASNMFNNVGLAEGAKNCVAVVHPAADSVYTGTGWTAMSGQALNSSASNGTTLLVQSVIAFPSANGAAAFYSASSPSWSACSSRQIKALPLPDGTNEVWLIGPISSQDGVLTMSASNVADPTWILQRALSQRNNVVIDVMAISASPSSQLAVAIAKQIAANVPE